MSSVMAVVSEQLLEGLYTVPDPDSTENNKVLIGCYFMREN